MSSEVPKHWQESALGDLCQIAIGGTPPRHKQEYWATNDGGHPWVAISDMRDAVILRTKERITDAGVANSNVKPVPAGTVLMSFKLTIGRVAVAGTDLFTNEAIAAFQPGAKLDKSFLPYWLEHIVANAETDQAIKGATLNKKKLAALSGVLPPLDEQQRIAEVLRSVDEAIAAAREAVGQAKSTLEAATTSLAGLAASSPDWRHGRCDSFFVLQRGFDITERKASPGPYRVISSSGPTYWHLKSAVEGPAVITGRKGRLGTVFYSDEACWPHDTTLWVKDFKGNHPRFVYWKLREMDLKAYDAATSVPTLNRNNVHSLELAVPPLAQQIAISDALDAISSSIEHEEEHLAALQSLKSSVSQDLLAGRVRVPA